MREHRRRRAGAPAAGAARRRRAAPRDVRAPLPGHCSSRRWRARRSSRRRRAARRSAALRRRWGSVGGLPSRSRPGSEGDRIRCRLSVAARPTIAKQSPTAATTTHGAATIANANVQRSAPAGCSSSGSSVPATAPIRSATSCSASCTSCAQAVASAGRAPASRWPAMTCTVSSTASAAPTTPASDLRHAVGHGRHSVGVSDPREAEGVLAGCAVDQVAVADRGRARASPPRHDGALGEHQRPTPKPLRPLPMLSASS